LCREPRLPRPPVRGFEAQPPAPGRRVRRRRSRRLHRPAGRARRRDAAPVGRPREAGRPRHPAARPLPGASRALRARRAGRHRTVTWPIVLAVLCGAFLHASWNALIKSGSDQQLDTALIHSLGCFVGVALVASVGLPRAEALPWLFTSMVIHVGYY